MQTHLINSRSLSRNSFSKNENLINKNSNAQSKEKEKEKKANIGFGPILQKQKQLEISKKVRKMIHYDCNDNAKYKGMDDDIPDEDEIYIKENLLTNLKEKLIREQNHITE
jgi:hypothetical protein